MVQDHDSGDNMTTWLALRSLTPARIGLGRAGTSLRTAAQLDFQAAHALARDAVHLAFDQGDFARQLSGRGRSSLALHSAASDRCVFLQRPDLGRRLDVTSADRLRNATALLDHRIDLAIVVADGLSSLAIQRNALPFLDLFASGAEREGWRLSPFILVQQGRVAIGDEIGQILGARMVLMLIGERPGLSAPDSLGLYFTFAPRIGLTDAYRNCVSNIRQDGLSHAVAANRIMRLIREADRRRLSGVDLKDESQSEEIEGVTPLDGRIADAH